MSFSKTVQWWQEWQLRILVLSSLFLQYFLFMLSLLRKSRVPSWVRFLIWLAYLGSDAMALYALATLFNYPKQISLGVKVLWAPILLVHLGGQDCITAYNIEDNELWKRHALTAMSQVTVAVYVSWKSWSEEKSEQYLVAVVLLFIPGILKCILKPWDLKRVSINSLVDSSGSGRNDQIVSSEENENLQIKSLEDFVREAVQSVSAESIEGEVNKKPYDLFVDLAPPYSYRLRCLRQLVNNKDRAHDLVQSGLSATFDRLYTKESVLHQNFSNQLKTLLFNFIFLLRVVAGGCMFAVIVLVPISQGRAIDTDVRITYILLSCTVGLEYLIPVVILNRINRWSGDQPQWPDQVAQYNLIRYLARNKKCKTKTIRKLATLLVCKDYLDQQWSMPACKSSRDITNLVHDYLKKGWMDPEAQEGRHIKDTATYRAFNDNRGQWTLKHKRVGRAKQNLWRSLQRPFDESVILWHLATDFCYYTPAPFPATCDAACRSRNISNYMVYLLFVNPEMLMTGARRSLFREAYRQLKMTLKIDPRLGGAGPACDQERELALKIIDNIIKPEGERQDVSIVRDAWMLAKDLHEIEENMWEVIQGVWVEMLCFSAGRCRGYLHAKSLGQGGEYLSYIWLLLSYMGMETLAEKMQRTELQEQQATNNSGTTATSPLIPTGGSGNATEASMQVTPPGGHGDDITPASIMMPTGDGSTAAAATTTTRRGGANNHMEVELTQQRLQL